MGEKIRHYLIDALGDCICAVCDLVIECLGGEIGHTLASLSDKCGDFLGFRFEGVGEPVLYGI